LSTPNLRSLYGIYNFLVKGQSYSCSEGVYDQYVQLEEIGHMGHVREYTVAEMTNFLDRVGFSVESMTFRGQYPQRVGKVACRLRPTLRPFVSYAARRG